MNCDSNSTNDRGCKKRSDSHRGENNNRQYQMTPSATFSPLERTPFPWKKVVFPAPGNDV